MRALLSWGRAGADVVAAGMLAAMFATFVLQIAARYVFGWPLGWTVEVCLTLWLWLVFWTCAFCLGPRDHVTFDLLAASVRPRLQRAFALVTAGAIVVALAAALPATWDYVEFYRIKRSPVLRIRLNWVFSIYLVFAVVIVLRYLWEGVRLLRTEPDAPPGGEEAR